MPLFLHPPSGQLALWSTDQLILGLWASEPLIVDFLHP